MTCKSISGLFGKLKSSTSELFAGALAEDETNRKYGISSHDIYFNSLFEKKIRNRCLELGALAFLQEGAAHISMTVVLMKGLSREKCRFLTLYDIG